MIELAINGGLNHLCPGLNFPGANALQLGALTHDVMSAHPISQQSRSLSMFDQSGLLRAYHIYTSELGDQAQP